MKKLKRLIIQVGFRILKIYWFVAHPKGEGAGIVILKDDKVLLLKDSYRKKWGVCGGGIKKNEDPKTAILREVREELHTSLPEDEVEFAGDFEEKGDYKTDKVYVFKIRVKELSFEADGIEIDEARWFPVDRLPERTSGYSRRAVELAVSGEE